MTIDYSSLSNTELLNLYEKYKIEVSNKDSIQYALKIALNALYGACGNEFFRYFDINIAEGITKTGQTVIQFINNSINNFLNQKLKTTNVDYVIANDTDSAYIELERLVNLICPPDMDVQKKVDFIDKFVKTYLQPYIASEFERLANYLNCRKNTFSMKREIIADTAIWRGKKNYIMNVYDAEGVRYMNSELKVVGVESVRSSTPPICKTALEDCYRIMLNETDNNKLIEYVKTFKKTFMNAPISDIAYPRSISDIDKWECETGWLNGTPIHVKAAIVYNRLLKKFKLVGKYELIKNKNKIKFIYLKTPNYTFNNAIAFFDEIPKEFELDEYVDRELQFEKSFYNPVKSFAELIGFTMEKQKTLNDIFVDDFTQIDNTQTNMQQYKTQEKVKSKVKKTSNKSLDSFFN